MTSHFLCFFLFFIGFPSIFGKFQCKNLNGKSVDWFVVYKLPKLSQLTSGKEFVYFDDETSDWVKGADINDKNGGVGGTISQIYNESDKKTDFHLMYSDDDPLNRAESYRGHAKGVALFDSTTGFWLVHSVPNFPPPLTSTVSRSPLYPTSAEKYGQTFFCVSIQVDSLDTLANHWRFIQATPYSVNAPPKFLTRFPTLKNVIAKQSLPRSATQFWTSKTVRTIHGHLLMGYAKHRKFNGGRKEIRKCAQLAEHAHFFKPQ